MKVSKLLSTFLNERLLTESHEDLEFEKADFYGNNGNIGDYSLTLRDGITGVVYAVDCKINLVDKKYKIDGIQIHDYSFKTPKTLNGNETTAEVVGQFIKNNVNLIVSKAKTE